MPERPSSAVSVADGAEIRPLSQDDYAFTGELYHYRDNTLVAGSLAVESEDFVTAVRAEPWASPMVLAQDGDAVAIAIIASADTQSRHGRLVVLAQDPRRCHTAVALYVRQAFWSHPLHRLYAVLPVGLPQSQGYGDILRGCGFVNEGSLVGHVMLKGRMRDLDVFGLLRPEFDDWCRQREPRWLL
jgi:hypothetical protein